MKTELLTRKISFIQNFLRIQSEDTISKFEEMLSRERMKILETQMKTPLSTKEFNDMIDRAEEDDKAGRLTDARTLRKEVQKWK